MRFTNFNYKISAISLLLGILLYKSGNIRRTNKSDSPNTEKKMV